MDTEEQAFIEAITALAKDKEFRRSFLEHYHKWLNPPMFVVDQDFFQAIKNNPSAMRPGAITFVPGK